MREAEFSACASPRAEKAHASCARGVRMRRVTGIACLLILLGLAGIASATSEGQAATSAQSAEAAAANDSQSCSPCHGEIVEQLKAHPHTASARAVSCTDCHTVDAAHLRESREAPVSAHKPPVAEQNAACARCHADEAGPFSHEHPAVKVEGCATCHAPHGSANAKMLTAGSESALCLQCHAPSTAKVPHTPGRQPATQPMECTTCHRQIHGSNASEVFLQ
jgi:DmsE family decaheme c-type cytochrome